MTCFPQIPAIIPPPEMAGLLHLFPNTASVLAASQSGGRGNRGAGARAVTYVTYLPAVLPLR